MPMTRIDLNCDLGEGAGQDEVIMPFLTSVNIACGAHAGDEATMRHVATLARQRGVAVGAHPGFADREHFGRREIRLAPAEIHALVKDQVAALQRVTTVRHVKPHGALYNLSARDAGVARVVAEAVRACGAELRLFGLAGGCLLDAGRAAGLRVVSEVFADRTYQSNGMLTPRTSLGALVETVEDMLNQSLEMVLRQRVRAVDGTWVSLIAETICLHGDGPRAAEFARTLSDGLKKAGVTAAAW